MKNLRLVLGFGFLMIILAACSTAGANPGSTPVAPAAATGNLTVFAAASLAEAFTEIGARFEEGHPGAKVVFNFAGSQQLAQQLAQGAPADVFASANSKQMQAVIQVGTITPGSEAVFVKNKLVIIYPAANPAGIASLNDLEKPGLKLILATQEVPAGQYSLEVLQKASQDSGLGAAFQDAALANVVSYEENVRAVLSKVALGEADAGIVYMSDVTGEMAAKVGQIQIPDAFNAVAQYFIAPVKNSPQTELVASFINLVLSTEGQSILVKYGFLPGK